MLRDGDASGGSIRLRLQCLGDRHQGVLSEAWAGNDFNDLNNKAATMPKAESLEWRMMRVEY
jgi:hypothetical protein